MKRCDRRPVPILIQRLLALLVSWALVTAAAASVLAHGPYEVLDDTEGAIAEVLMHFDPDLDDELAPFYHDLFSALPPDVSATVLCPSHQAVDEFIEQWGPRAAAHGRSVRVINVGLPLSIWARDRLIARRLCASDSLAPNLLPAVSTTLEEPKINEAIAYDLAAELGVSLPLDHEDIEIEGGNVVANGRHVFVGTNVYTDNWEKDRQGVTHLLTESLGRDLLLVSDALDQAPWCHVDMYVTPIDDKTVLVGSPEFGARLIGDDGSELIENLSDDDEGDLQAQFDEVAELLQDNGYRVQRLPLIVNRESQWMITYNNVLMDERNGVRTVYLPVYDLDRLDRTAKAVYHSLGFRVRTVDVSGFYTLGGAVRCVVNVTRRRSAGANVPMLPNFGADRIQTFDLTADSAEPVWRPSIATGRRIWPPQQLRPFTPAGGVQRNGRG